MDYEIRSQDRRIDIKITGSVDHLGAEKLKEGFEKLDLSQTKEVVIDMKGATYIGSAGVGKLLLLYKNMPDRNSRISIINLSEDIYYLLADMELETIFSLSRADQKH